MIRTPFGLRLVPAVTLPPVTTPDAPSPPRVDPAPVLVSPGMGPPFTGWTGRPPSRLVEEIAAAHDADVAKCSAPADQSEPNHEDDYVQPWITPGES